MLWAPSYDELTNEETMKRLHARSLKTTVPILVVVGTLILSACGGGDDASAPVASQAPRDSSIADAPAATAAPAPAEPRAADTLGSGGAELATLQAPALGRDIIFRADLTVAVTDVGAAGAEATAVMDTLGGFLFGQQTTGGPQPRSVLTFKVEPANFQRALDALGSIGEIRSQNVFADDVTERVVDLQSRIATAETSVDRLRAFLTEAANIETIVQLERELSAREATLESLRGQLRTIEGQVALATITLLLTEADISPDMLVVVSNYLGAEDSGLSCPADEESAYVEGDDVTVCFDIFNNGDTDLTGFTLRDSVLGLELADLTVVLGDPGRLEPGQSLVLATDLTVERDLRTQTRVTAEPVKEETGEIIAGRTISRTETSFIVVDDAGGLPGFGDSLSASWDVLKSLGGIVVVLVAAAIPFLWLALLALALTIWLRRRDSRADHGSEPENDS